MTAEPVSERTQLLRRSLLCAGLAIGTVTLGACAGGAGGAGASSAESSHPLVGAPAPAFELRDVSGGGDQTLEAYAGKVLIVDFWATWCEPCKQSFPAYQKLQAELGGDLAIVGISSNDVSTHPDDSPTRMKDDAQKFGYTFPYLYDEAQSVAKAYQAACTPDFFLFDKQHKLVYRGQFDDSRPQSGIPVTGKDLRAACDAVLAGKSVSSEQKPSIGCNIKWKAGQEPKYFTGQPAV